MSDDLDHLFDLLDLMPDMEADYFWPAFNNSTGDPYLLEKLYVWTRNARERLDELPDSGRRLAEYCLMFFGDPTKAAEQWPLDAMFHNIQPSSKPGLRWAEDVAATAWRIFVPGEAEAGRQHHGGMGTGVDMKDWPPPAVRR
ncbi:hypothetical protein [Pseudonocardia sp. WMMC193]|uniref:hypothetical protein n=1 Tax=Pseudonocardia sp. WMMC193 TaxID=2911965 RepID=UPI001F379007|nr:hypothetical protein [Pseudonocardia sp. WMMC193]MCF7548888.1 hypothetical protein [Pseudonocardia sp. WMMC193]